MSRRNGRGKLYLKEEEKMKILQVWVLERRREGRKEREREGGRG